MPTMFTQRSQQIQRTWAFSKNTTNQPQRTQYINGIVYCASASKQKSKSRTSKNNKFKNNRKHSNWRLFKHKHKHIYISKQQNQRQSPAKESTIKPEPQLIPSPIKSQNLSQTSGISNLIQISNNKTTGISATMHTHDLPIMFWSNGIWMDGCPMIAKEFRNEPFLS